MSESKREDSKPVKVAMIGGGSVGLSNVGLVAQMAVEREQEIRSTEMKKRRELIASLSNEFLNHDTLKRFEELNRRELRQMSKEFRFIHEFIKDSGLSRMAKTGKGVSSVNIRKLAVNLSFILHSKQFSAMDMEDSTSDYFKLTLAIYVAVKAIDEVVRKNNIDMITRQKLVFVSSELGLRLYTMYVDERMDM